MSIIKGTNQIVAGFGGTKENIGDVKWSYSKLATDNSGRLPLFTGETIASANTIYPEFYNWVLSHTELQCTSAEYEAALTTYGECAKYATKFPVTNTAYKYNLTGLSNALSSNYSFYKKNENGDYEAIGDQTYYYTNEEFIIEPLKSNEPTVFLDEKCTQKLYAEHHSGASAPGYYEVRLTLSGPNSVKLYIFLSDVSGLFIAPSSGSVTPSTIKNTETILTSTTYETNGSIRLPLIKNYIKAANPSEGIKNIEAGLPNIIGYVRPNGESGNTWPLKTGDCSGAFSALISSSTAASVASTEQNKPAGIRFDASRSSAVYGKSSTVTPASTTLYPWVVAYTAAIPASTAQAAEFQQGLSGKADTNLGNLSTAGKDLASGLGMPSSRYIDLTLGASGSTYTAPANGYVAFSKLTTATNQNITIDCNNFRSFVWGHASSINIFTFMPVKKNDIFTVNYNAAGNTNYFRFIYAEGDN